MVLVLNKNVSAGFCKLKMVPKSVAVVATSNRRTNLRRPSFFVLIGPGLLRPEMLKTPYQWQGLAFRESVQAPGELRFGRGGISG